MGRARPPGPSFAPALAPALAARVRRFATLAAAGSAEATAALAEAATTPGMAPLVLAWMATDAAAAGDPAAAARHADAVAAAVPAGSPPPHDALAAARLAVAGALGAAGDEDGREAALLAALDAARTDACRAAALARLALAYGARRIPLGLRFYAGRALRIFDSGGACGVDPAIDADAARLAAEMLEYLHRRDEPGRGFRAFAVLDRVRDALPDVTVRGLRYHGLALGRLKDWEGARRAFLDAARIAEERSLRGCDGVYVYAAAVMAQERDFAGARRLLARVRVRRLDAEEKALHRQFRHLVATAEEHRPLRGERARRFLEAREAAAAGTARGAAPSSPEPAATSGATEPEPGAGAASGTPGETSRPRGARKPKGPSKSTRTSGPKAARGRRR